MARATFIMAEPEPEQALSARKLVLETAKFNVITSHSVGETRKLLAAVSQPISPDYPFSAERLERRSVR